MSSRELEITILPDGSVEVHVRGFKGRDCLEAAKVLEEIVGRLESQQPTHELYEPEEEVQRRLENRR